MAALREIVAARAPEVDLAAQRRSFHPLTAAEDGSYAATLPAPPHGGDYTLTAHSLATAPGAEAPFARTTMATVMVG